MKMPYKILFPTLAALLLVGCGSADQPAGGGEVADLDTTPPDVTYEPKPVKDAGTQMTIKPQSPIRIGYRIIGQPVVGQPVAIDLRFESSLAAQSFDVEYRINDTTALSFPETQARRVTVTPPPREAFAAQQLQVIPMREGRLFLNVAAEVTTDAGTISSVTAVPIDVGAAPASPRENGTVTTDEEGELIRTLPGTTE